MIKENIIDECIIAHNEPLYRHLGFIVYNPLLKTTELYLRLNWNASHEILKFVMFDDDGRMHYLTAKKDELFEDSFKAHTIITDINESSVRFNNITYNRVIY